MNLRKSMEETESFSFAAVCGWKTSTRRSIVFGRKTTYIVNKNGIDYFQGEIVNAFFYFCNVRANHPEMLLAENMCVRKEETNIEKRRKKWNRYGK